MSTEQFSVDGQTVVITGSSSGIGREIAERFAADGADVVVSSRELDNVQPVADGINDADGGRAIAVECDVTDRDAVEAMVDATVEEFGGVDCLVNNAGASFMAGFEDISPNGWETIVDINLTGTFHCTQVAGERMREGDGGTVINLASVAGQKGSPHMSHYGAAKAGVINLTETLGIEWAPENVRVNAIAPGFVATPGVESQMGVSAENIERDDVARQIGHVAEIADLAQFLASDASSYLVGETVAAKGVPRGETSPDV
ncbi:SDR family NAD(P)-dependent oxidoreductase [Halocalculus aciditolerans]|uniref:3-oxoacyl-ACP reductase n=1 Tax=Halocalculus aciditolerans TaxID=1383812 RepID=A0A830FFL5_9EURY|nr:SDR family NAD(P)-dependent oxidoreductase [Halocalculus aciditolerans]GGL48395.1 3-oxoacyl-ACP reductase [Halocalculus aciditolerans]